MEKFLNKLSEYHFIQTIVPGIIFTCFSKIFYDVNLITETYIHRVMDSVTGTEEDAMLYVGTVHSVKGLEFDHVIVLGVNGRQFKLNNEDNWNVYYVAITRAKTKLTIFKIEE